MVSQESTITIQKMENKHLRQVLKIEKDSFSNPWSKGIFKSEINSNEYADYYVAMQDDKVVGYAGMWIILDEVHVTTIAVSPDMRKNKLGELLLNKLFIEAAKRGAERITLEVRPSNTSAKNLYYKLGFRYMGIRKGYYSDNQEDALVMWKNLRSGYCE